MKEIPKEIKEAIEKLQKEGWEAYIVGGCVRDLLLKRKPSDWDIATNANPKEIENLFPRSFLDNRFGTVTVVTKSKEPSLEKIEITPYRIEGEYKDKRRPEEVSWTESIKEDLKRRDFTINALALSIKDGKKEVLDLHKGREDLKKKIIRAVGDPKERIGEDALRMMRAVRLSVVLGFKIEEATLEAIKENSKGIESISKERIRDELIKIIMSKRAVKGIELLRETGLLKRIIPELLEGFKVSQNKHHIYDCYEHSLNSLEYAIKEGYDLPVRLAALFHDIGKPRVKEGKGEEATFYNHEVVGAEMTKKIMERLKFPKKEVKKVTTLVRYHLFYYNVGEVSESSVRRLLRKVGKENIDDLIKVRKADRIGSGVPKAEPYRLRHLQYLLEKVSRDPISTGMLKIDGRDIMKELNISPGRKIGMILNILLREVIKDPEKNEREKLIKEVKRLGEISEEDLEKLYNEAREEIEKIETKRDEMTKKKYWVT